MKSIIKFIAQSAAAIIMAPFTVTFFLLSAVSSKDLAISGMSQLLSLLPGKIGNYLRAGFYRFALKKCSPCAVISFGTLFSQADTEIGTGCYIGPQCNIGLCLIENDVLIGSGVHILSGKHQHNFSDSSIPVRDQGGHLEKIRVGVNSWLGNCAIVMANIGDSSVVAAGSVVVNETEPGAIVAGNPAKLIKLK